MFNGGVGTKGKPPQNLSLWYVDNILAENNQGPKRLKKKTLPSLSNEKEFRWRNCCKKATIPTDNYIMI